MVTLSPRFQSGADFRIYRFRIFHQGHSKSVPLQEPALIVGKSPDNEVVLDGVDVPDVALRLTLTDKGYSATTAHPKAKPLVNGMRADQFLIAPGDLVEPGAYRLFMEEVPEGWAGCRHAIIAPLNEWRSNQGETSSAGTPR